MVCTKKRWSDVFIRLSVTYMAATRRVLSKYASNNHGNFGNCAFCWGDGLM